jgi:hypothetical protein
MSLETMIGELSRDEKLAAMDLIWRDLTMDESSFVFTECLFRDLGRLKTDAAEPK